MRNLCIGMLALCWQVAHAEVALQILDQDQQPVSDAVVLVVSKQIATPQQNAIVDQIDSAFVPRVAVIQKGQSVAFPNSDDIRHHVYSFSEPKSFEIKLYKGSDIAPIEFDQAGLVILGCNIHDDMIGYIFVADNQFAVKSNENGWVTLPVDVGDEVTVWSERFVAGVEHMEKFTIGDGERQRVSLELYPVVEVSDHQDHDSVYDW
ncbi:methylamine utilization protein [Marinomonas posidonica]|uniref:methylamine utilization protein n=1 Tax=Marinomonas posidonica TaxID=936476 RepID=UPI00373596C8